MATGATRLNQTGSDRWLQAYVPQPDAESAIGAAVVAEVFALFAMDGDGVAGVSFIGRSSLGGW